MTVKGSWTAPITVDVTVWMLELPPMRNPASRRFYAQPPSPTVLTFRVTLLPFGKRYLNRLQVAHCAAVPDVSAAPPGLSVRERQMLKQAIDEALKERLPEHLIAKWGKSHLELP